MSTFNKHDVLFKLVVSATYGFILASYGYILWGPTSSSLCIIDMHQLLSLRRFWFNLGIIFRVCDPSKSSTILLIYFFGIINMLLLFIATRLWSNSYNYTDIGLYMFIIGVIYAVVIGIFLN